MNALITLMNAPAARWRDQAPNVGWDFRPSFGPETHKDIRGVRKWRIRAVPSARNSPEPYAPGDKPSRVLTKDSCKSLCVSGEGCGLLQVVQ